MAKRNSVLKKLVDQARRLEELRDSVLCVLMYAILVHDAKDGRDRAKNWPLFSASIKRLKWALR